jgi:hypothetical protein
VLVELSVMEQRYQAVLAVVQDGWKVVEVARESYLSRNRSFMSCQTTAAGAAWPLKRTR